jgi:hypothetical protein
VEACPSTTRPLWAVRPTADRRGRGSGAPAPLRIDAENGRSALTPTETPHGREIVAQGD